MKRSFEVNGKVWKWLGGSFSWYFIHINKEISSGIRKKFPRSSMVPVEVKVGDTVWSTSLFKNKKDEIVLNYHFLFILGKKILTDPTFFSFSFGGKNIKRIRNS
mgnify:CR=1 FL=1